mmetsp:Transcript_122465/g.346270  ORF Transcript_122465/g.346270 Transcript_122465/m.346270 type:complete len:396 (-) Transcript_122465:1339-2526(-)
MRGIFRRLYSWQMRRGLHRLARGPRKRGRLNKCRCRLGRGRLFHVGLRGLCCRHTRRQFFCGGFRCGRRLAHLLEQFFLLRMAFRGLRRWHHCLHFFHVRRRSLLRRYRRRKLFGFCFRGFPRRHWRRELLHVNLCGHCYLHYGCELFHVRHRGHRCRHRRRKLRLCGGFRRLCGWQTRYGFRHPVQRKLRYWRCFRWVCTRRRRNGIHHVSLHEVRVRREGPRGVKRKALVCHHGPRDNGLREKPTFCCEGPRRHRGRDPKLARRLEIVLRCRVQCRLEGLRPEGIFVQSHELGVAHQGTLADVVFGGAFHTEHLLDRRLLLAIQSAVLDQDLLPTKAAARCGLAEHPSAVALLSGRTKAIVVHSKKTNRRLECERPRALAEVRAPSIGAIARP